MKNIFFILLLVFFAGHLSAQALPDYDNIKLERGADYGVADSAALKASSYLLSAPFQKNDPDRLKSLQFIIKWMTATPDYSFLLDNVASKIARGNDDLLGLYMAAMTKYCLENKAASKDPKLVKLNAIILLLNYCENNNNHMDMTKNLKKLSEAKAQGRLEQAL